MRPRHPIAALSAAVLTVVLLAGSPPAMAGVPSGATSQLPSCLALCPFGDLPFSVVVRDPANDPIAGSSVVLDFSACPGAWLCRSSGDPNVVVDLTSRTVRAFSSASGAVSIAAHVGGTGPAGSVRVYADGVLLRSYALASPDQDGDGFVVSIIGQDDPIFAAKLGSADHTADFDCSGLVDIDDEQIFFFHHSQACDGYVDATRRSSWAGLKLHYR